MYKINSENRQNLGIRLSILLEYNLIEIIKYIKGMIFSWKSLKDELLKEDLKKEIKYFRVPVYIISGKYDNITPQELVEDWIKIIDKNNIIQIKFNKSAHSPHLEEPILFNKYLQEIIN